MEQETSWLCVVEDATGNMPFPWYTARVVMRMPNLSFNCHLIEGHPTQEAADAALLQLKETENVRPS